MDIMRLIAFTVLILLLLPVAAAVPENASENQRVVSFILDLPQLSERDELRRTRERDLNEELDFVIFRESGDCRVGDFEVGGGCHAKDSDPLGIYFPGYTATCEKSDGTKLPLSKLMGQELAMDRNRVLLKKYRNKGPFEGCLKPDSWKRIAGELCRLSCLEKHVVLRTTPRKLAVQLPVGKYFFLVPEKESISSSGYQTGYKYPITPFQVKKSNQSFPVTLEIFETII